MISAVVAALGMSAIAGLRILSVRRIALQTRDSKELKAGWHTAGAASFLAASSTLLRPKEWSRTRFCLLEATLIPNL
jgi:hypothetical protein